MEARALWRDWVQTLDVYSPELENSNAIGDALKDFEESLLAKDTSVSSVHVQCGGPFRRVASGQLNDGQLIATSSQDTPGQDSYQFYFVNRYLSQHASTSESKNAQKLQLSGEALRLLASRYHVPPSFLFALSRFYLPHGHGFRRYENEDGKLIWTQWYFLPLRVQVPCTDKQRSHSASITGSSQTNPFHYLHLPDEQVDIRGSQIAVYLCHDGRNDTTTIIAFNFMHGGWPKIIEEPQVRMSEALRHPNVQCDSMAVHLVFLTTVIRWWNNALHTVNEQLIAYERRLHEENKDESAANAFYNETSKAIHAISAHVHRYGAELDALEQTTLELGKICAIIHGQQNASFVGIDHVKSQLMATNAFVREQEKKIQNILALLFNRMQIANDRIMVSNGKTMNQIMRATQEEAERSRQLAKAMKKDSVSMKAIAILTMFFLPATSFAALLAMPFFTQNKYLADVSKVWIWAVLTVPTTAVAYAFYYVRSNRDRKGESAHSADLETGKAEAGNASSDTS